MRTFQAVWFSEAGQDGGYFTLDGRSTNKVYLASPLLFSRVSSGYGMRFHPIHGDRRAQQGVDYAAPTGTPVRTVGDGVVEFAGWQRGYGNVIVVSHRNQDSTLYAHLSRIDARKGQRVSQGQARSASVARMIPARARPNPIFTRSRGNSPVVAPLWPLTSTR